MSGGVNSVQTNAGAMIALNSLEETNSQLAVTEKQVSTGYRVADSTDDGAAYAIALTVRSTVGALNSANQQLGNVQGLLGTTQSGLNSISTTMGSMRDILVKLSDGNVLANDRKNYVSAYQSMLAQVKTYIQDADYNGKNLIGNVASMTGANGTFGTVNVARNEAGSTYSIATFDGAALYNAITFTAALGLGDAAMAVSMQAKIAGPVGATPAGTFITEMDTLGKGLNTVGSEINFVNNQVSYNSSKIDSLNSGLGAMVDADLAKESAQLTALQIRQQLGTQALSLANQAPQALLSLFK
jgi:flagellin